MVVSVGVVSAPPPALEVSPEHIQQLEAEIIALKQRYSKEQAAAASLGRVQQRRNSASPSGDSGQPTVGMREGVRGVVDAHSVFLLVASLDTNPLTPLSQAHISTSTAGSDSPSYNAPPSPDVLALARKVLAESTPVSTPGATKGVGSKSKSSCHQCKSSKPDNQLLFCTNRAKDSQRKRRSAQR